MRKTKKMRDEEDILGEANKQTPSYIEIMHIEHQITEVNDHIKEKKDRYRVRDKRLSFEVDFTLPHTPIPVLTLINRAYNGLTQKYNASLTIEQEDVEETW